MTRTPPKPLDGETLAARMYDLLNGVSGHFSNDAQRQTAITRALDLYEKHRPTTLSPESPK